MKQKFNPGSLRPDKHFRKRNQKEWFLPIICPKVTFEHPKPEPVS